ADGLPEGLAQHDGGVLHRVVTVDVEVADGFHGEVEPAVAAELVEHVIVEGEPGADTGAAGTAGVVEIGAHREVRFFRGPLPGRHAAHPSTSSRAARKASSSSRVPMVTRR